MKSKLMVFCAHIVMIIAADAKLSAQTAETGSKQSEKFTPVFKNLTYEEDYSSLEDSTLRNNFYKKLKYIPLYRNGYMTLGGETRLRMEIRDHLNYGNAPEDRGPDFQQRTRLWADYHFAKNFRAYAELQSGTSSGLEVTASPLDKDELEVHQAFIDTYQKLGKNSSLVFRLGRQEIALGKTRLFDNRNPPNIRRSYDAARVIYTTGDWQLESFGGFVVDDKVGFFNDGQNKDYKFFATHIAKKDPFRLKGSTLELLYILTQRNAVPSPTFYGTRNTFSGRFSGITGGLDYDIEGVYQFGNGINGQDISAWFIASETNYTFAAKSKPRVGYKLDIASGDKNADDGKNNSYDYLWSRGISFASDLGYTNIMSVGPSAGVNIGSNIKIDFWAQWLWRNSLEDGIYKASNAYQREPSYGSARYIGFRNLLKIEYQVNPYVLLGAYGNSTYKGTYLKENDQNENLFYGILYSVFRF